MISNDYPFARGQELSRHFPDATSKGLLQETSDGLFLKAVIESWIDGILILTEQGDLVQANNLARQICTQLTHGKPQPNSIFQEIWRICQALSESRKLYPNQPVIIESEITTDKLTPLRIRVRWLNLKTINSPYLLVILEDQHQSLQNQALAEAAKYGLTPREAEVWLLRRAKYTLKEIAAEQYISINTVKKHLKNIQAKKAEFEAKYLPSFLSAFDWHEQRSTSKRSFDPSPKRIGHTSVDITRRYTSSSEHELQEAF